MALLIIGSGQRYRQRTPRLQAISYAIMLARLAYDGKLAVNLIREDNGSGQEK
jgi:hypothetical protein